MSQGSDSAAEPKYFFCRLLPPRPTFMADMTPEEREMMGRHAAYWKGLLDRGVAIVFGPVADPSGGYGVGIIRASSREEMQALQDGDPAIASGKGLRYEVLPMLRAVHAPIAPR